jgi:response regulator RpfG family c-di-GMP phosphodiesterase
MRDKIRLNILLADDDKDDRLFFAEALKQIPIPTRLKMVEDGEKLIDFLSNNKEQLPDIIFLDLNMPRKNGNECLCDIKRDKKLSRIPVIIYSTSLHEDVADVLYKNGAHYYLKKCNIIDLPMAINHILTLWQKNHKQPSRAKFSVSLQKV